MSFSTLGLSAPLLRALEEAGYTAPTPIQAQAIPLALDGRDLLGIAQTGTGKTAAFALPMLHRLAATPGRPPRAGCHALVLSPTRELASQIADNIKVYGRHLGLSVATVFGGVPHRPQVRALERGVDIVVGTPGRLLDHLNGRTLRLDAVRVFVLDEADRMLDQGFLPDVRRVVPALPRDRQTLFFSATMPREIERLAADILREPARVEVTPAATTVERIAQRVLFVEAARKRTLLAELLRGEGVGRTLVFARTKHGADRVAKQLGQDGIAAHAIHGNKSQGQRERALAEFRAGRAPVLVATDIAARGIDVDGVTHVVQFDLPDTPESYVHRIGRTARAGASGVAIALCAPEEREKLQAVEKLIRLRLPAEDRQQGKGADTATAAPPPASRQGRPQRGAAEGVGHGRRQPGGAPAAMRSGDRSRDRPPQRTARPPRSANGNGHGHAAPSRPDGRAAPRPAASLVPAGEDRKDRRWRDADFRDGLPDPDPRLWRGGGEDRRRRAAVR
ncbi:RNA helicase [Caldovatus sediminis]|uniref:DEAD-box ATP-dependent RNA helicase RhpA n=1 Tax=Caldovatus sediminis TaxID=2041189 RepID=A0A8J2ZCU0_9PROT|nr:DEAD/DEAH box helicase [Caldovatus sediminis]GGG37721.1 RNA helicase [Caldovatus sediminis]